MSSLLRTFFHRGTLLVPHAQLSVPRSIPRPRTLTRLSIGPGITPAATRPSSLPIHLRITKRTEPYSIWRQTVDRSSSGSHPRVFSSNSRRALPNGSPQNPRRLNSSEPNILQIRLIPERGSRAWYAMVALGCGLVYYVVQYVYPSIRYCI